MQRKSAAEKFARSLSDLYSDNNYVVFLCGPTLGGEPTQASSLRRRLQEALEEDGFEVILGEDDGLEELRKKYSGTADHNELAFIHECADAVVIVAHSVGSFCELGLFSYACMPKRSRSEYGGELYVLAEKKYEQATSYFNHGPARAVDEFGGWMQYVDFENYCVSPIIRRLRAQRTTKAYQRITKKNER